MKLTPLVIQAGLVLPRHTALFSDLFPVTSIGVVSGPGSYVTLTTPSAHGVTVGDKIALSITDAETPNTISAATVNAAGDLVLTTAHPHDLTTTPDPELFDAWTMTIKVAGFSGPTAAAINGTRQVVATPDRNTVVIKPGATITSPTLAGTERILERIEGEIIGWHAVEAVTSTTLRFPTPPSVTRSYTITSPVVVSSIRVYGALDYDTALAQLGQMGGNANPDADAVLTRPHMFILPVPVRARGRVPDRTNGSDYRDVLDDGFTVLVFIPSQSTAAHVKAIDLAQGAILRAVLRTFNGLKINRSELAGPGDYQAVFESHNGAVTRSRAIYAHEYVFQMPAEIGTCDSVSPTLWGAIDDAALDAVTQGTPGATPPTTIYTSSPVALRDLDVFGILHHGHPSPLTATFDLDEAA